MNKIPLISSRDQNNLLLLIRFHDSFIKGRKRWKHAFQINITEWQFNTPLLLKLIQLLNAQSEPFFTRMIKVSKLDNKAFWTHIWPLPTNRSGVTNKNIYMPRFGENLMKIQNSNQFERLSKQQSINLRITLTGRRFWRERQKCRLTFIASKKL